MTSTYSIWIAMDYEFSNNINSFNALSAQHNSLYFTININLKFMELSLKTKCKV